MSMGGSNIQAHSREKGSTWVQPSEEGAGSALCQGPEARKILVHTHTRRLKEGQCVRKTVRKGECMPHSGGEAVPTGPQTTGKVLDFTFNAVKKAASTPLVLSAVSSSTYIPTSQHL